MPNTSSSVPFMLNSSLTSLRSRRPSSCLSGSQGSGLLQQLGSGMVRQLTMGSGSSLHHHPPGSGGGPRSFPNSNVRSCPAFHISVLLSPSVASSLLLPPLFVLRRSNSLWMTFQSVCLIVRVYIIIVFVYVLPGYPLRWCPVCCSSLLFICPESPRFFRILSVDSRSFLPPDTFLLENAY